MEKKLKALFNIILEEVNNNPEFKVKVESILLDEKPKKSISRKKVIEEPEIDPVDIIKKGQAILEKELIKLEIDELKKIIKFYGMDSSNSSSRWRKKERLVKHIVEVSLVRSKKGHAFRQ